MNRYKLVAKKDELTRHIPLSTLIELLEQEQEYRMNGFITETFIRDGDAWEKIDL